MAVLRTLLLAGLTPVAHAVFALSPLWPWSKPLTPAGWRELRKAVDGIAAAARSPADPDD